MKKSSRRSTPASASSQRRISTARRWPTSSIRRSINICSEAGATPRFVFMTVPAAALRLTGIKKSFGATRALRGVSLEVAPGEVHALIGENGAGKSTLMKVLSGAHAADEGTMELNGQPYVPSDPNDAR